MKKKLDLFITKAVASGNDFIIVDNKTGELDARDIDYGPLARELCERHMSVGADGLLVLQDSDKATFRMRVINPDGSEVDMCGNGARCSSLYGSLSGWGETMTIETGAGILSSEVEGDMVKLKMSDPRDVRLEMNLGLGDRMLTAHYINTGVPHVIHEVEDIDNYDVVSVGKKIRRHTVFEPEGTNANFVGKIRDGKVQVRTYERGVEDETLACGTGTVASAVVMGLLGSVSSPVNVLTRSGEVLTVYFNVSGKKVTDVFLEGRARMIFEGKV